jgi:transmembrane sensor
MDQVRDELLARYLTGEAGPEERARVDAWAAADPAHARELARLRAAWATGPAPGSWDVEAAWRRVERRLDAVVPLPPARRRWGVYAAAAAVILAVAGVLGWPRGGPVSWTTAAGEQRTVELADGSRVVLAPASRLTVPTGYGRGAREVTLEGRAWFEVGHDSLRPFRVLTATALIEDLGTVFEVRAPATGPVRVAVIEGAVAVRARHGSPDSAVTLGPGDLARVPPVGPPVVRHDVPVTGLTDWRRGVLRFDDEPLAEVLDELAHWYGLEFRLQDPGLADRRLSADVPTADLAETLAILGAALGLDAHREAGAVVLRPRAVP